MNDEATASSAEPHPTTSEQATSTAVAGEDVFTEQDAEEQRQKIAEKKATNLKEMIREFDILVYAQLAAVYYMDTSLLRFFLRAFMQLLYFTPKPPLIPTPPMKDRPYLGAIFGSNLLCLILHLYMSRPSAGEATRGYLHGGLLIDFIGQKGPTSKWLLALLDVGITVLQMIMLAVVVEDRESESHGSRKSRRRRLRSSPETAVGPAPVAEDEDQAQQDHDAEERGTRRSTEAGPLLSARNIAGLDDPAAAAEVLDRLRSGQAMTAKLYIADTIRDEWRSYTAARAAATGTTSSSDALSAAFAQTGAAARLGFRNTGTEG